MGWLRNKNTLKVFSFLYGPVNRPQPEGWGLRGRSFSRTARVDQTKKGGS